ncbi:MAG: type III pantothenate kinase [Oscillospiraceae bacterium]|nr:type III pantothenate kinase [Oscillospiraceae bacterium]MBR2799481.1 type III pantothenate kinase [Oscillospiraceae bacterium]
MILAIDAGNTDITFGTIEDGVIGTVARIHTERDYTPEEYGIKIKSLLDYYGVDPHSLEGAILSSVVPPVTNVLRLAVNRLTGLDCLVVGPGIRTGMNVRIDDPTTLAADLAVGSVAAIACYGAPAIVLEFGTATSMVVVDARSSYRGGVIMPGVRMGLQALSSGTSLLPDVALTAPAKVIGTNTADAMRSGAVYATASMIDGMIARMEEELGCACTVVATGRNAPEILAHCRRDIQYDENLLLKGLWVLYRKNRA